MKLALYLPNFREKVTVKELEDLTALAEELDFDSVWTLDRVIVPESSDRGEMEYAFGMIPGFPKQLPVSSRGEFLQGWPLIPWLAAKTSKGAHRDEHHRHAIPRPRRARRRVRDGRPPLQWLAQCRRRRRLDAGGVRGGERLAHLPQAAYACARDPGILQGIWTNEVFEYHGEFADFGPSGFGVKPLQKSYPPIYFSGLKDPKRSANRVAKYDLARWIGIQDSPDGLKEWRGAIQAKLDKMDTTKSMDDLDIVSMIWFVITDVDVDQSDLGKGSSLLVGSERQITDMLKRYQEAGLTMPMLWPPFADVSVAKTLDDMKRLVNEIMPKVNDAS